jgi:hypothetical protein
MLRREMVLDDTKMVYRRASRIHLLFSSSVMGGILCALGDRKTLYKVVRGIWAGFYLFGVCLS